LKNSFEIDNFDKETKIDKFIRNDPYLSETMIIIKDIIHFKDDNNKKVLIFEEAICDLTIFRKIEIEGVFLSPKDIVYIIKTILETF
jgi:hypothetical protein